MKIFRNISCIALILVVFFGGCKKEEGSLTRTESNTGIGKEIAEKNGIQKSGTFDSRYLGTYRIRMTGFTGVLKIFTEEKILKGSIQFSSWGRGKEQPLKRVSIKGEKIYFIRSVSTRNELEEYGGSRYFKQEFYGRFSSDGSKVKGYFKDSGAQNSWDGRK